jgi:hypothetical protein
MALSKKHLGYSIIITMLLFTMSELRAQSSDTCAQHLTYINFAQGRNKIDERAKKKLDAFFAGMKRTTCIIRFDGDSWERISSVIDYLIKKGMRKGRFVFAYDLLDNEKNKVVLFPLSNPSD